MPALMLSGISRQISGSHSGEFFLREVMSFSLVEVTDFSGDGEIPASNFRIKEEIVLTT